MDFTLDEEQSLLVETSRSLLAKECPTQLVRAHTDDPSAADQLWKTLSEWTLLAGQPLVNLCLFLEQTGAFLAPGPFFATTALFAPLLAACEHELASAALAGEATGTVAIASPSGNWAAHEGTLKSFVLEADRVDYVAEVSLPGPTITIFERPTVRQVPTLDSSRRIFDFDSSGASPAARPVTIDVRGLEVVVERATVALAAEMSGTTSWIFETTLAYAKARHQFGRPIGSFQAIKHKLANMSLLRQQAESAAYYAAMAIDAENEDRHRAAHVAKVMAGDAASLNLRDGMQIHGGIGYTFEHDLHLYIRRAVLSDTLLGTPNWHRDQLADLIISRA